MERHRFTRAGVAALIALGSLGLAACDEEDEKDLQEGVRNTQENVEEGANDAENAVDNTDTDGQDD